jgi:hypothetical protein
VTLSLFCKHDMAERLRTPLEVVYVCKGGCGRVSKIGLRCVHEWKEVERTVSPPMAWPGKFNCTSEYMLETVMLKSAALAKGSTDILYECSVCHEHNHMRLDGAEESK